MCYADRVNFVCTEHLQDAYLAKIVEEALADDDSDESPVSDCSYCDSGRGVNIEDLVEIAKSALNRHFRTANDAGVPWEDGGFVFPTSDTHEALDELDGFDWDVVQDIAAYIGDEAWVSAEDPARTPSQRLGHGWRAYADTMRHRSRFLLSPFEPSSPYDPDPDLSPDEVLRGIASVINSNFDMIDSIPSGTPLYRARTFNEKGFTKAHEVGAPPARLAAQGRMNAAGISVFYAAFDAETAAVETFDGSDFVVIASFVPLRELTVVDLTKVAEASPFNESVSRKQFEDSRFLRSFVAEITRPIIRDSRVHFEYVPTQYFTEFLRWRLLPDEVGCDGIVYPSARTSGRNIVVFASAHECLDDSELPPGESRRPDEIQVMALEPQVIETHNYGAPSITKRSSRPLAPGR